MHSRYKIVVIVLSLLLILSVCISAVNYKISLNNTQKQLISHSLPLSVDNVYTEIQKEILEPYLISSMMAENRFLARWIEEDSTSVKEIQEYLQHIKERYKLLGTFLVSEKKHNYYSHNGFVEVLQKTRERNSWYFNFKNSPKDNELNMDTNEYLANEPIMFINFKIFDKNHKLLGVTGVAIKVSHISKMLDSFKEKYKLDVNFLDNDGNLFTCKTDNCLQGIPILVPYKKQILSSNYSVIKYAKNDSEYIIATKYIKELDARLLVEAKVEDFLQETKRAFYLNISFSLFAAFGVALILIYVIRKYSKRLEKLSEFDELTKIPNRRSFNNNFTYLLKLQKRLDEELCLLYIDIDDFKKINDTFGHEVGDKILQEFAHILRNNVRESDLYARWGGEEFIVVFSNTTLDRAKQLTEKIRLAVENSVKLYKISQTLITMSAGLTRVYNTDSINSAISRADEAMYNAKSTGKNRTSTHI